MDDDIETNNIISHEEQSAPVRCCFVPCRLRNPKLSVIELVRFAFFITLVECTTSLLVLKFVGSDVYSELILDREVIAHVNLRILPALILIPIFLQYATIWLNLIAGGWGAPESRFWCDMKIMYVRGFNTIRTISQMCSTGLLLGFLAIATLGMSDILTLAFLCPLAAVSEWQAGLIELQNQYDVKLDDKFAANESLCMESLHYHQQNRSRTVKTWTPFVLSNASKLYVIVWILYCASVLGIEWSFYAVFIIAVVTYVSIIPCLLQYVYLRGHLTFSEVELYRTISDCTMPCIICFAIYTM